MYISRRWLSRYIDLSGIDDHTLDSRLTLATAEVEGVQRVGAHLEQVATARILAVDAHPHADKLHLVTVTLGAGDPITVVCGAPNVAVGLVVALARVGAVLPGGELKPAVIRGVESRGMLCSSRELGLDSDHAGIMVLPSDTPLGHPLSEFVGVCDSVIEIDNKSVTHRPDLWGHLGFARELSAIFGRPYHLEIDADLPARLYDRSRPDPLRISDEAGDLCPRYCALVVDNVAVKPSPRWMQQVLTSVGLRPINNIVDVTNFVMCELGQPLHAFDRRQIQGDVIRIRRAGEEERFTTLDGLDRLLSPADVVIADAQRAVALGGVMGGLNSEIVDDTVCIIIESATFDPATIRRTSSRLGLRTEAAMRYEKSQDPENAPRGALRALALLRETCPDLIVRSPLLDDFPRPYPPVVVETDLSFIRRRLGIDMTASRVVEILTSLEFVVEQPAPDRFIVTAPSFRATKDIEGPYDIVEELGRIHGFDNIPEVPPLVPVLPPLANPVRSLEWKTRDIFAGELGFTEVMNYSFVGKDLMTRCGLPADGLLRLKNPVSVTQDRIRTSLVPGLLEQVAANLRFNDAFAIFEMGRGYEKGDRTDPSPPLERRLLAAALVNDGEGDLARLRGAVERYIGRLHRNRGVTFVPLTDCALGWAHPGQALRVEGPDGVALGVVAALHPRVARAFDISRSRVVVCELDLGVLFDMTPDAVKFTAWSEFPRSRFELTVVAPDRTYVNDVAAVAHACAGPLLTDMDLISVYQGPGMAEGTKAVSFRFTFGSRERTLTGEEIEAARGSVLAGLDAAGYPLKR